MEPKVNCSRKPRPGRGFSLLELKKAKIDARTAKRLNIRVDRRRKTAYDENVNILKDNLKPKKKPEEKKAKGKPAKKAPVKKKAVKSKETEETKTARPKKPLPPPPKKKESD
ncbi:MAG: ribosomal protein L13e [Thermoplasmata archaeon]|nr:MAG: ribosomal protein L13e [Thermoplasmata archaeon]